MNVIEWREIIQSGGDFAHLEGFALEQLIDLQRDQRNWTGGGR